MLGNNLIPREVLEKISSDPETAKSFRLLYEEYGRQLKEKLQADEEKYDSSNSNETTQP